jgi:hypothetical protein
MLHGAITAFESRLGDRSNPCIRSAFVDSALLHARNLFDFLTGHLRKRAPKEDQILAAHFIGDKNTPVCQPGKLSCVKSHVRRINEFRSHLSHKRLPEPRKVDWSVALVEIRSGIDEAFREFIGVLPVLERDRWKKDKLEGHRADFRKAWLTQNREDDGGAPCFTNGDEQDG